ncbi:MAG TPA: hypothetical protein VM619_13515 [Luteimonas sp.]|nr:hypothetical protein [Luteimonas sp.]
MSQVSVGERFHHQNFTSGDRSGRDEYFFFGQDGKRFHIGRRVIVGQNLESQLSENYVFEILQQPFEITVNGITFSVDKLSNAGGEFTKV